MSCPICGKPADSRYRPFCTRRCADVDLARWLNGSYAIHADINEPLGEDDETEDHGERRTH